MRACVLAHDHKVAAIASAAIEACVAPKPRLFGVSQRFSRLPLLFFHSSTAPVVLLVSIWLPSSLNRALMKLEKLAKNRSE